LAKRSGRSSRRPAFPFSRRYFADAAALQGQTIGLCCGVWRNTGEGLAAVNDLEMGVLAGAVYPPYGAVLHGSECCFSC